MPVYRLTDETKFPPPEMASEDGLLAIGGDLRVERLLLAYSMGIFPWYSDDSPILWWSPEPRFVLLPHEMHLSRSLHKFIKQDIFDVTMDRAFEQVITRCAEVSRHDQDGTWITDEMVEAYCRLHSEGFAHSVECWHAQKLVGGLYGVSLGKCFFGESMFSLEPNASKMALLALCRTLIKWNFNLIDCQISSRHLESLGAKEISRKDFLYILEEGLKAQTRTGIWNIE